MTFDKLHKSICDNLYEAQLKIGISSREVRLNYMWGTLSHLLGCTAHSAEIGQALSLFSDYAADTLGRVEREPIEGGFCLVIPPRGSRFVSETRGSSRADEFLKSLIELVSSHKASMADVEALFLSFDSKAVIEDSPDEEFDKLAYLTGTAADGYRYYLSEETFMGHTHVSYHRLLTEDHEELFGG